MIRAIAGALVVALVLPACGVGSAIGLGNPDELTIYSGRSRDLVEPLLEQFAEDTGVAIGVKYGDSTDLALLLAEEGDSTRADVFLSQSPGTVGFLAEKDLLRTLPESVTSAVPEAYRSASDTWVGVTARQRVLVYNQDMVDEADLPSSVLDLTAAKYEGLVGVAPSNASFQDFVTAMRQQIGDDEALAWLTAMAENDSPVYANNNAIVEAVGRGEIPLGLVNHYYNERFLEEDPSLPSRNYRFPDGDIGSLVIESSATVLAATDRPDEAEQFISYLLETPAQEYFAEETFEYPLVEGVDTGTDLPPLDDLQPPDVDVDSLGSGFEGTQELIDRSGIAD